MAIETNTDDLTDGGVVSFLMDIAGIVHCPADGPLWRQMNRARLQRLVEFFDRASPNWPHTVLGLPLIEV